MLQGHGAGERPGGVGPGARVSGLVYGATSLLFPGRGETQELGLGVRRLGTVRQPRGAPGKAWSSGQVGRSACGPRSTLQGLVRSLREGVGDGKDEVVSSPWRASVTQGLAGEAEQPGAFRNWSLSSKPLPLVHLKTITEKAPSLSPCSLLGSQSLHSDSTCYLIPWA